MINEAQKFIDSIQQKVQQREKLANQWADFEREQDDLDKRIQDVEERMRDLDTEISEDEEDLLYLIKNSNN